MMKQNSIPWTSIVLIVGLWLIALGLSVFVHKPPRQEMSLTFIEALIYLVFLIILSFGPLSQYFAKIPRPHKLILTTFFTLLLIGQFVNQTSLTFPFTSWAMYGRPEHQESLIFTRCIGVDENQNKVTINTEALFSFADKSEVASKFKDLVSKAFLDDNLAVQREYRIRLTEWLHAIGQIYNYQHPEQPIHSVELQKCTLNLNYSDKLKIVQEPLMIVNIERKPLQ
jgi:hypothetical protein